MQSSHVCFSHLFVCNKLRKQKGIKNKEARNDIQQSQWVGDKNRFIRHNLSLDRRKSDSPKHEQSIEPFEARTQDSGSGHTDANGEYDSVRT